MKTRLFALLATLPPVSAVALASAAPAAAMPVFDATNYQQNLLSAARALEQINHQIASLQHEATRIQQQARQLEKQPYVSVTGVMVYWMLYRMGYQG